MGGETERRPGASSYPTAVARPVAKLYHQIYKDRCSHFEGEGQYAGNNLRAKLHRATASGEPHVKLSVYSPPDLTRPTFKEATSHKFVPTKVGKSFGPSWSTHWFKVHITVPSKLRDAEHLEFHWNAGNEGLIWNEDGEPLQGLTGGGDREEWILPKSFRDGKEHTFYIEMACNAMFGNAPGGDSIQPPAKNKYFELQKADIVCVNLEARALFFDFWIIKDASREFSDQGWQQHQALQVCTKIMDCFEVGNGSDDAISECRKIARTYIGDKVDSSKIYDGGPDALVTAIGHCHIDTCWLWPWAETKRKIARSWSNQCDLLDRYPELRFCCSQAQQYKWLETYYPSVFDRVKTKVKENRFQPIGGSWVEHDTNMPSGESLVRQFLYGQRYFESRFGQRSTTFWLPDTFGYSSQLPQVSRLAGMPRFFTQKLSWNNINVFPHTTFNWVALDGSQVLCHMAPAETYTAEAEFGDVQRSMTQHKSMDQDPTSLLVFGKGDGGGGPTWGHIEKLRRCRGVSDNVGQLPRVKLGDSVDDFFAKLEKRAEEGLEYVTWYGELYLELHRGTYTTQANNKRNNRKSEILLHDVEYLATMATIKDMMDGKASTYKYPKEEIDFMWEGVLLCQFHDCLPGSSIEMCYDDSDELYEKVFKTGEKLLADALDALGFESPTSDRDELVAINTLPWARDEYIKAEAIPYAQKDTILKGEPGLCRIDSNLTNSSMASVREVANDIFEIFTEDLSVTIASGVITSLYDKRARREIIPKGSKANQFVIFDDKPLYWQAWDVEVYHLRTRRELAPSKTYIGEVSSGRAAVIVETQISECSSIKTEIALTVNTSRTENGEPYQPSLVEISSKVDWHEDKQFLKVEFPVNILNNEASYETQYGIVRRATHFNTDWDMAKFEVCCHRWADLSEATYGVSILNDSKYGFATQGRVMRLSLLRAPKAPDAHADMGTHYFRYAIMPHQGPLDARTVRAARAFNSPLVCSPSSIVSPSANTATASAPVFPFMSTNPYIRTLKPSSSSSSATEYSHLASILGAIKMSHDSSPGIILDTIKRGENDEDVCRDEVLTRKGEHSIIVRLYDSLGGLARGRVEFGAIPVTAVKKCNVLEDEYSEGEEGGSVEMDKYAGEGSISSFKVELRPFEVQTYKLVLS